MPTIRTAQFPQASARAVGDAAFRRLLDRLVGQLADARSQAVEQLTEPVWEQLRERAHYVRAEAVQHLDYYLELLDRSIRRNGGHVHFARDAAEANQLVLEIAQAHGVRRVVKSKSMLGEELGITQHLERHGIETVETDLGEYIIQLAKEPPFHIMAPAMHKTRQEVSDLFQRHLGAQPTMEVGELTKIARDTMRQRFAGAEMGITGANFLVAETGMAVLVTNEGNGRMTADMPRIHVAIAGIDKVVPAIEDVAVFLKLLARSATGQPITSYTTFIGGPKAQGEEDGPEEFHVVVVDNGRTKLLEDPELREALYCINCGACSNVCPVYQQVGGHTYGWVYSGPIGAVISPVMTGLKEAKALPYASTLCGACRDVCPVKIDLPRLLVHLRWKLAEGDARTERSSSWVQRLAMRRWADTVKTRVAMERAPGLSRLLRMPGAQGHRVPLPLGSGQDLPAQPVQSFHQLWHERLSVAEESD